MTTTNGTRLLLAAAARCETVLVALAAQPRRGRRGGAGERRRRRRGAVRRRRGRVRDRRRLRRRPHRATALGGEPDDAAVAAVQLAGSFATAEEGIGGGISAENIRNASLDEDIAWCARESVLDLVPRVVARRDGAVEIALA